MKEEAPEIVALALAALAGLGCRSSQTPERPPGVVEYVGSSTVARFLRAAEPVYGAIEFRLDTEPESLGGEQAIVEGRTDFAGIARSPMPETLDAGVRATLVGRDAIAVAVHADNPVANLSRAELRDLFTGRIDNWRAVGGPDLAVETFIVGAGSATREVFRDAVLGPEDYAGCTEVRPDEALVEAIAAHPGAIGPISFSFLRTSAGIHAIAVDGDAPRVTNFGYPIARPLYLLSRDGAPVVEAFVNWAQSEEGQRVVRRDFVGSQVQGSVSSATQDQVTGTLVVYTETDPVYDGGIYYYPHRSYEILDRAGDLVRRVLNHRGQNDESPTRIDIAPGTYLIRTTAAGRTAEFYASVESGKLTELDVVRLTHQE